MNITEGLLRSNLLIPGMFRRIGYAPLFAVLLFSMSIIFLYLPSLIWFTRSIFESYSVLNLILLLLVVFFLIRHLNNLPKGELLHIQFRWMPFILLCSVSVAYALSEIYARINMLSCGLFFLALFSISGFFMTYENWKKGILPTFLLIQTLPLGPHLDVYLGFPLRLFAAGSVTSFLSWFNISEVSKETIIMIENRSAEVSSACSGLNGLWTSWLFFFTISWIENKKINFRWLQYFMFLNLLIYSFNLIRIITIVFIETVLDRPVIAGIVHIPLGIAGFLFSCIITWFLLHYHLPSKEDSITAVRKSLPKNRTIVNLPALFSAAVLFTLLSWTMLISKPATNLPQLELQWPADIIAQEIPITMAEYKAFERDNSSGKKFQFSLRKLTGTCLIVYTNNWRGHHPPDLCTQANGFSITKSETRLITPNFPVTLLSLDNTTQKACYWFQSSGQVTHDHASRVWTDIKNGEHDWVMISILLDQSPEPYPEEFKELSMQMNLMINEFLTVNNNEKVNSK
ncbi:exosortase O [Sporocytophaga myxococcoides]|uniref:exosortase O n=1 Tax=Sporocytophaga myxococcoides TaxID=153721 RepID=UPI0003F57ED1|nr:exosortase O [Sporocytophaga myxococcoides]